ncbi:MAG TPA: menaquinone biosynthesis protein [Bacteroidia bacterium]|nr:menaquinone biosynthesis protein [Bacteroidia bacterium]
MNQGKTRVSIVNYTNTLPFKWALKRSRVLNRIDLQEDIPSICAEKLKFGQVELALVPVALLPELDKYKIVSDYCIGAEGKVDTVKLYSRVPVQQIKSISLDYQSKTSNALVRVLFKAHWKQNVQFKAALPGFERSVADDHGIVVIGDRCFGLNGTFEYEYDLAEEWKKLTGLPFVFAAWVAVEEQDQGVIEEFNTVLKDGLSQLSKAVEESETPPQLSKAQTLHYLQARISYDLDAKKREALKLFLSNLADLPAL